MEAVALYGVADRNKRRGGGSLKGGGQRGAAAPTVSGSKKKGMALITILVEIECRGIGWLYCCDRVYLYQGRRLPQGSAHRSTRGPLGPVHKRHRGVVHQGVPT
jgi:hypothetical protein